MHGRKRYLKRKKYAATKHQQQSTQKLYTLHLKDRVNTD